MFNVSVLQANLPETSPFLSAQIALVSDFFQMFILLGMYNVEVKVENVVENVAKLIIGF